MTLLERLRVFLSAKRPRYSDRKFHLDSIGSSLDGQVQIPTTLTDEWRAAYDGLREGAGESSPPTPSSLSCTDIYPSENSTLPGTATGEMAVYNSSNES